VFPWAQGIATVLLLFSLIRWIMLGGLSAVNWVAGTGPSFPWMISVTTIVLIPSAWLLTWYVFSARPRSLLRHVAGRLESGQLQLSELSGIMPRQLSAVLNSKIPNEGKARTISELIPLLPAETMRNQQFAIHMLGPMVLAGTLFLGIYALLAFAVPDITSLFIDWGVDLPILTEIFVDLSDMFSSGGLTGWCLCFALFVTTTLAAFWLLSSGIISDWMESVPLVGVGFRWTMLSRVARLLAVMIRNDCPYPEALRAATGASHVRSVRTEGDMLARELESGGHILIPPRKLKGLPISMLFATDGTASETRRRTSIASTFQILAEMLDNATVNQGRLLALFLHFFIVMSAAVFVLLMMVGCFLPLIKMMNDIS
jgi:type II secretory pathway component PulF